MKISDQDKNKSLEYLKLNHINSGQIFTLFVRCIHIHYNFVYYGIINVESGYAESLDDHCDQCFNEPISFFAFKTNSDLCDIIGSGIVGLKKFNFFKNNNQLDKIIGNIEIIESIII